MKRHNRNMKPCKRPLGVIGDFNYVLNRNDRVGNPVSMAKIRDFKNYVGSCGLQDLDSIGAYYT